MAIKRNPTNELYFIRALYGALLTEVGALVTANRDGDRSLLVVATPPERVRSGEYLSAIVVANKDKNTTIPYLELFDAEAGEATSELKSVINDIVKKPKNSKVVILGTDDTDVTSFRNKFSKIYNDTVDDTDTNTYDAYPELKQGNVFSTLCKIFKSSLEDVASVISDEMDEEDKENFKSSIGKYRTANCKCSKEGRAFNLSNGIKITIHGFDDENDEWDYETSDVSYKIKREVKFDGMY